MEMGKKEMGLYAKQITITGKHATYMKDLANPFDTKLRKGFFQRNIDVYLTAPIVGKLYNRKADPDHSSDDNTKIFTDELNREMDELVFNYRLIVLLEDADSVDIEERCNRAFRYDKNSEKRALGDEVFQSYLLGGIEVLHEKLFDKGLTVDERIENLYDFANGFTMYEDDINYDEIIKLSQLSDI